MERDRFVFFKSYHETLKLLNDKEELELVRAIRAVQFLEKMACDIKFETPSLAIAWANIKPIVSQSVNGFLDKTKTIHPLKDTPSIPPATGVPDTPSIPPATGVPDTPSIPPATGVPDTPSIPPATGSSNTPTEQKEKDKEKDKDILANQEEDNSFIEDGCHGVELTPFDDGYVSTLKKVGGAF